MNDFSAIAIQSVTMSTREIAELCKKRHDHVMRDVRDMLVQLYGEKGLPIFGASYINAQNKPQPEFHLPKRETLILVSGYRLDIRTKIIDRWQQLEAQQANPMQMLADPVALRGLLADYTEKVLALQGEVEEMRPQVQALERIAHSEGSMCITDAAKNLQIQPKALFSYLREHHWVFTRLGTAGYIAYQDRLQSGMLEHKVTVVTRADGTEKITTQVRVTPKGLACLSRLFPPVVTAA